MNVSDVLGRLDAERRALATDGEILEQLPQLTRSRFKDNTQHCIAYAHLPAANADRTIEDQKEYYRLENTGFEWKVFAHDEPRDLVQRLERHEFVVGPMETVMVYDLAELADWMVMDSTADAVVRVDRADLVEDFRQVAAAVFPNNCEFTAKQLAEGIAMGSSNHRGYIAYNRLKPVSIGRLYTHPQSHFGGLFGGGTLAACRGSGFYRAIVAARARDARTLGAQYLIVDALPTSRPILERLGFHRVTDTWPCTWTPPAL